MKAFKKIHQNKIGSSYKIINRDITSEIESFEIKVHKVTLELTESDLQPTITTLKELIDQYDNNTCPTPKDCKKIEFNCINCELKLSLSINELKSLKDLLYCTNYVSCMDKSLKKKSLIN